MSDVKIYLTAHHDHIEVEIDTTGEVINHPLDGPEELEQVMGELRAEFGRIGQVIERKGGPGA